MSEWLCYSSTNDVNVLSEWLNNKCKNESNLKKIINNWKIGKDLDTTCVNTSRIRVSLARGNYESLVAYISDGTKSRVTGEGAKGVIVLLPVEEESKWSYVLREWNGLVFVSSVSVNMVSSLKIGDIILVVDNANVTNITDITFKFNDILSKRTSNKQCPALVLRHDCYSLPRYACSMLLSDAEVFGRYCAQECDEKKMVRTSLIHIYLLIHFNYLFIYFFTILYLYIFVCM